MFKDVVVVSAVRTPVGRFGGSLKDFTSVDLAALVIREAVSRAGLDPAEVDEVVMGCVGQHGLNAFLARLAAIKAGLPIEVTAQNVNRLCSSGMQAIITAAVSIDHGDVDVAVAGGSESMSSYPYSSYGARWGLRMGNAEFADEIAFALAEPFSGNDVHIGKTAENIVEKYGITRERLDAYAVESQERAAKAIADGLFKEQILPVEIKEKKSTRVFDTDEHPRLSTLEQLAALKPFIKADGKITAGNASGINDGAAAMVMMRSDKAAEKNLPVLARVVDYAVAGVEPSLMGIGPVASTNKLLKRTGFKLSDFGLVELNEAFAAQTIACIDELGLDYATTNVNGSGISLGHPIGATGAIISTKLYYEMKRRNVKYGLATLCIGGGQGMSIIYENPEA